MMKNKSPILAKLSAIIFAFSFSSYAFSENLSQWYFPSNSVPVLYPNEIKDLPIELAIVNTDTWLVSLLDLRKPGTPGATCYEGRVSDAIEGGAPLKINGKYVKFNYVCMGEVGIMQPMTEQGKKYLNDLVLSGSAVTIIISEDEKLTFPESDVAAMKKKVLETKGAM